MSERGDNNAIMAQLLLLGTNFLNFVGHFAWVGTEGSVEAVQVTEWDEPQAVIGSFLHQRAYPKWYQEHLSRERELRALPQGVQEGELAWQRGLRRLFQGAAIGGINDGRYGHHAGEVGCLQLRGEYLFVAQGKRGMQAYDVANIANKGFSERFVTAPFSPLGQDTHVASEDATCIALPTNQPMRPELNRRNALRVANQEQRIHDIYSYVAITDSVEGLILVDIETLSNFEPRDNFLERTVTFNPDGVLDGARYAHFVGHRLYVSARRGIVVVNVDEPLEPEIDAIIPLVNPRASMQQFRYLFAVDDEGFKVVDITQPERPRVVEEATIPLADARRVFVARTYAYIAGGSEGLVVVDVERPEAPEIAMRFDGEGKLRDARDVIVGTTNASLFAYVADARTGLAVVQLTSPELQPKLYGFSPKPNPRLIAWRKLPEPATALSRPLERDRAVDESGNQIAVFGRIGSRPFDLEEMQRLYLEDGELWTVDDRLRAPADGVSCAVESR